MTEKVGKTCARCNMPDVDGTLWVMNRRDDDFELWCGSCLRREVVRLSEALKSEREACAALAKKYDDDVCCDGFCGTTIAENILAETSVTKA